MSSSSRGERRRLVVEREIAIKAQLIEENDRLRLQVEALQEQMTPFGKRMRPESEFQPSFPVIQQHSLNNNDAKLAKLQKDYSSLAEEKRRCDEELEVLKKDYSTMAEEKRKCDEELEKMKEQYGESNLAEKDKVIGNLSRENRLQAEEIQKLNQTIIGLAKQLTGGDSRLQAPSSNIQPPIRPRGSCAHKAYTGEASLPATPRTRKVSSSTSSRFGETGSTGIAPWKSIKNSTGQSSEDLSEVSSSDAESRDSTDPVDGDLCQAWMSLRECPYGGNDLCLEKTNMRATEAEVDSPREDEDENSDDEYFAADFNC